MLAQKKLLIIDDEPKVVQVLKACFESKFFILTAYDGKQGFEMALREKPDLILSDVLMPKMDGFELLEKLKGHVKTKDIPVILLTSVEDSKSIYKAQESGIADYLIKPIGMEELFEHVKKYV